MVYPMGGLEYSYFKILWSMRIFPKEIVFFILESSESPVFFNEESEINFLFWISEDNFSQITRANKSHRCFPVK